MSEIMSAVESVCRLFSLFDFELYLVFFMCLYISVYYIIIVNILNLNVINYAYTKFK